MYTALRRFIALALLACIPLVFAGCGSGGGDTAPKNVTVSGVAAINGPISGAQVTIYQLRPDGSKGALIGSGVSDATGNYAIEIPATTSPVLVEVTGNADATYDSNAPNAGAPVAYTSGESMRAVLDGVPAPTFVAVTPLSEFAYVTLQQILTATPPATLAGTVAAANTRVAGLYGVDSVTADPAVAGNNAALQILDQMNGHAASLTGLLTIVTPAQLAPNLAANGSLLDNPAYAEFQQQFIAAAATVSAAPSADLTVKAAVGAVVAQINDPGVQPDYNDTAVPTVPTGLTATAAAATTTASIVTLSWSPSTDNSAVAGYSVFRNGVKIKTVATTSYADTVAPGQAYVYAVVAFDAAGNSSAVSATATVTPVAPNLSITVNGQVNP